MSFPCWNFQTSSTYFCRTDDSSYFQQFQKLSLKLTESWLLSIAFETLNISKIQFVCPIFIVNMNVGQTIQISFAIHFSRIWFFPVQLNEWESYIFSPIKPKLELGLFVDFCVFTCFYQFLHDVIIKLFCRSKQNNFMITSCKNTEINKQSDVKFWLNWRKYRTVSRSFSCKWQKLNPHNLIQKMNCIS